MMAACEKCWRDAQAEAYPFGSVADAYERLIRERRDNPCTPEQQCGDMHLVCVRDEQGKRCRCGKVRSRIDATEEE